MAPDYEVFELGDYRLQSGVVLPDARLAYQTYGELNAVRDNVVVYPTAYGGTHANCEPIIGAGLALDPSRYSSSCRTCSATASRRRPRTHLRRSAAPTSRV